jgi:hypothetical protein
VGPFEKAMRAYAVLDDAALEAPWSWRGGDLQVRDALYRSLGDELDAVVRSRAKWERDAATTDAERILSLADRALGSLRGLLVGLDDALLDRAFADGEWTLRQTLRHMLEVERRYATNTSHAVHRRDDERLSLEPTDPGMGPPDPSETTGGFERVVEKLVAARDRSDALLGAVPNAALERPSRWSGVEVTVRFRLYRFAEHLLEHTIQCEKTLEAIGVRQGEARRIVRQIWSARGELEAVGGDPDTIAELDAAHDERIAVLR